MTWACGAAITRASAPMNLPILLFIVIPHVNSIPHDYINAGAPWQAHPSAATDHLFPGARFLSILPFPILAKERSMNNRNRALFTIILACLAFSAPPAFPQAEANYTADGGWAGGSWDGNTSWVTADGKGNVVVLVRTAPYFRVYTRDGTFVKSFGEDGLFESAHSVTIDSQGFLWATDSVSHVVHKFSPDGELLLTLGT